MYIITDKTTDALLDYGRSLDYMSNGYPRLIEKNTAYQKETVNVFQVSESVSVDMLGRKCYNEEKGFYDNPNWKEQSEVTEEQRQEIEQQTINEILEGVQNA